MAERHLSSAQVAVLIAAHRADGLVPLFTRKTTVAALVRAELVEWLEGHGYVLTPYGHQEARPLARRVVHPTGADQ